ncbi:MAG TPA: adenylate/guanylate cyclase domain-containing protein [Geminicoccaceae bacterium]|nr:adenylate/guanylate cyclase domain-containing protein [Geminicoccaceae bacterium]
MDIGAWLRDLGLERYAPAFRDAEITPAVLPELTEADLKELGLPLGPRKLLLKAIASLPDSQADAPAIPPTRAPGDAERRQLTVLFCDLVGSTELSARLDPEDMREVMRAYQDACAGEITRFEGHVAKFLGDGVLAYFGWPQAHEDEAERAVQAALALIQAIPRLATPAGEPLAARVGIATGLVVVGDLIGEQSSEEQAVVGDTPNLAARLQALAAPNQVVIADATAALVGGTFEFEDLGPQAVKGLDAPVAVSRVTGERPAASRFEARAGPAPAPMVGRDQELALLLERWAQAKSGEGQGVLLIGEAGIGKSRIVRALLDAIADEPHTRIRYQCSPYHTDSALWPVIQQLTHAAGLADDDSTEARLDKLEALLAQGDGHAAAPLIADLLGIDAAARYGKLDLTPQAQRARTLEALGTQLLGLAARQSTLLVLEDAHWIDPSTLELVGASLDRVADHRVLMLITSRPDNQPELAAHPHVTRLTLNRLSRTVVEAIVARLGGSHLPADTIATIIARTDGVPLFVEELTKSILETGDTRIPASLHDSLMARLDRLPEVKELAQLAACIGRMFNFSLLAAVAQRPDDQLQASLDKLAAAELIFRRGAPPNATYSFKHALVRDAAYESLLRSKRQQLHARIAACLEERFAETVAAVPEVLAHHHGAAGETEAAFGYWFEAGRRAAERSANQEAIEHLTKARSALDTLPAGPARDRRELDVLTILGPAVLATQGFAAAEAEPIYLRVRELGRAVGDREQDIAALQALRTLYQVRGRLDDARIQAEELLDLGRQDGAEIYRFEGHRALGTIEVYRGRLRSARDHLERALVLYDPARLTSFARLPHGHPGVIALSFLASTLDLLGFPDQAKKRRHEASRLAKDLVHPFSLAQTLAISLVVSLVPCRRVHAVDDAANELLAVSLEQGFEGWRILALGAVGWARAVQSEAAGGVADLRRSLTSAKATSMVQFELQQLVQLAEALGCTGEALEGLSLLGRQRRLAAETGLRHYDVMARRVEAELRLKLGEPAAAESCLRDALEIARRQGAKALELLTANRLARLWQDQGDTSAGRDLLAPIYGWFTEGFDTPDLIEAKALLDELG